MATFAGTNRGIRASAILQGGQEFAYGLNQFRDAVKKKIVRFGVAAMARVVVKPAKALAPRDSGLLKRSIGVGRIKTYPSGVIFVAVEPRKGHEQMVQRKVFGTATYSEGWKGKVVHLTRNQFANPRKYAHLVELGVAPHSLGKSTRLRTNLTKFKKITGGGTYQGGASHPGFAGRFFLKRALETSRTQAIAAFEQKLREGIEREAVKLALKKGKR